MSFWLPRICGLAAEEEGSGNRAAAIQISMQLWGLAFLARPLQLGTNASPKLHGQWVGLNGVSEEDPGV